MFYSDSPKSMDVDKIKKEDKGIKKEKEEPKEGYAQQTSLENSVFPAVAILIYEMWTGMHCQIDKILWFLYAFDRLCYGKGFTIYLSIC